MRYDLACETRAGRKTTAEGAFGDMAQEISRFCECGCGEVVTERYKYTDNKTGARVS